MKIVFFLFILSLALAPAQAEEALPLDKIELLPGFRIQVFASGVPNARSLALGDQGTLFVGTRLQGKVFALRDTDADGVANEKFTIAEGLNMPNGVAFRDGALYVAEIHRVLRFDAVESALASPPEPAVVYDRYPTSVHHGWKYIAFGPDGKLYVPVGTPCNVCERPDDKRFASITRLDVTKGGEPEVFAEGIRNTVGFAWHPHTKELWFTDNGRDMMGDDLPPDELNHAPKAGMHFGFPYRHGKDIPDPRFGALRDPSESTPAAVELGPHVAALGMKFYTGEMFPAEYRGDIFIAEHGSWNRTKPLGYRIMKVDLKDGAPGAYEIFAEGWLSDGEVWGRPVDVLVHPDGSLFVSDDHAGTVYRITYAP